MAGNLNVVDPMFLIFNWYGLRYKFEVWRLVTPFMFVGGFSFDTLITLYMLVSYSQRYEISPYNTGAGGGSADYAFMLILSSIILNAFCLFFFGAMLLVRPLVFTVLYLWTKREPNAQVSIFGFPIQAKFLPFALLCLDLFMGKPVNGDIIGIGAGHLYYFIVEIVPALYGKDFLHTPEFLINFFGTGVYVPPAPTATQRSWPGPGRVNPPNQAARSVSENTSGHNWGSGRPLGSS